MVTCTRATSTSMSTRLEEVAIAAHADYLRTGGAEPLRPVQRMSRKNGL